MAVAKLRKIGVYALTVVCTITLALLLGIKVGDAINARKLERFKERRLDSNRTILAKMENIEPGSRVENYHFQNLDGDLVGLRDVMQGKTLIVFLEPDCPGCLAQIERIQGLLKERSDHQRFVFISSGNPFDLLDLREEYDIRSPILYDHGGAFSSRFKVSIYPFNLFVSERLEIEQVVPGQLTEDEIIEIMESEGNLTAR